MSQTADRVEREITWFFSFYRQRAANAAFLAEGSVQTPSVRTDAAPSMDPEVHVLIAAGLDTLAKHWAKTFNKTFSSHRTRMGEFLASHGGHQAFKKCSAPHLLLRAQAEGREDLVAALRKYLGNEKQGGGNVRYWHHDPDYDVVAADPAFPTVDGQPWVRNSRYGEVIYKEYRNMWLHEYRPSENLSDYEDDRVEPLYQNIQWIDPRPGRPAHMQRLRFPKRFLLEAYRSAIDSFERECRAAGIAPDVD
jgi:hypothetical protein